MKQYLLDTNICIYIINRRPPAVKEKLHEVGLDAVAISGITVTELFYGVSKSARPLENTRTLRDFLNFLAVMPFGIAEAEEAGKIRVSLEASGKPIGPYDLLMAAQAKVHEMVLVTNNQKEFKRIKGLRVENWV